MRQFRFWKIFLGMAWWRLFVLSPGLSTVFLILGYGAGLLARCFMLHGFSLSARRIVILLRVHQMEVINLRQLKSKRRYPTQESGAQWILQCFSDRGHLQFWLDLVSDQFEFCSQPLPLLEEMVLYRLTLLMLVCRRLGATLLSLGSGL